MLRRFPAQLTWAATTTHSLTHSLSNCAFFCTLDFCDSSPSHHTSSSHPSLFTPPQPRPSRRNTTPHKSLRLPRAPPSLTKPTL
ncbi:hypothetical protein CC86DRAFT_82778 [Ophiobolus disseminans]|uniref:Uncharacterized protein n=1 Tax=Ophiobolus disseminans TaxID=1469910 RepID=A0A6A7AGW1_9PLEO|nr:hypothetical protein CC86DRAFT_82778 [Ophiobolus disseminans]